MRPPARKYLIAAFTLLLVAGFGGHYLWRLLLIGTAYKAKILCSGVFVSNRDPDAILGQDLSADDLGILRFITASVDHRDKSVTSRFWGFAERRAVYRPGLGCTLVIGTPEDRIRKQEIPVFKGKGSSPGGPLWPQGESIEPVELPSGIDAVMLREAVSNAFNEKDGARPGRTRAVIILYKGRIIAEKYAEGFSKDTPLPGWSMTKSVVNALVGVLVRQGKLSLDSKTLIPEWSGSGDPRGQISLDQMLRMCSGLGFNENYSDPLSDVVFMLLGTGDAAGYAADKPLETEPGSQWQYSSGTTNIISRILRDVRPEAGNEHFRFPQRYLFSPVGMHSAVMEPDASGTFVGSSFMYATARDWARFGLLYLQDGIWEGERILPEGWVQYSTRATPQAPNGRYGAHFWLRIPRPFRSPESNPILPAGMYHAIGHEGQFVTVVPSHQLVIVRLGLSRLEGSWNHEAFVADILSAIAL